MTEEMIVSNLVQGEIDRFRRRCVDFVRQFYAKYDPSKSLDKSFVMELLSRVHSELDCIIFELEHEYECKKDNC